MANEQNLIPFDKRTESEQREIKRKGGKKSGEKRRQQKTFKELFNLLLDLPVKDENTKLFIESLGVDPELVNNDMALVISMYQEALRGNTKAFELIRDTKGEKPADKIEIDEPPKIILERPKK